MTKIAAALTGTYNRGGRFQAPPDQRFAAIPLLSSRSTLPVPDEADNDRNQHQDLCAN